MSPQLETAATHPRSRHGFSQRVRCVRTALGSLNVIFRTSRRLSLYKILFFFKALLWKSSILLVPPPQLQSLPYCNTVARPLRDIRPPTDPSLLCHATYKIGEGNIL